MPETPNCPQCGALLPSEGWAGLCPKCLVRVSLDEPGQGDKSEIRNPEPEIGHTRYFGDYELLEEIARGGMGVVYKARQVSLNRTVAVKMILAGQLAGAAEVQRFRGEAEAAANLSHPNIVAVHEIGQQESQHYFSMDYVEGQNLAEFVGQKPLPPKQGAKYLQAIAEAIQYAHERGILHRDLKPSNILIDQSGQPRITDFGLAKRMKGDSDLTISGQVLGSPNFMPPEQAAGRRAQVGRQSDIYALGAILFYLLTARPPFAAESMTETLQLVVNTEPPSPRLLAPGVPRDLETICLKCLSKEPHCRYSTAQELADELGRFLRDEPILARPIGAAGKGWRWCRRNPVIASFAGVTAVLLLAVAIGSPIAALRINRERSQAQQNLIRQFIANGNRMVEEGDLSKALPWFARAFKEESSNPDRSDVHRLRMAATLARCPRLVQVWFHADPVAHAKFSPDGHLVLTVCGRTAQVWDTTSGQPAGPPTEHHVGISSIDFSIDGRYLITCAGTVLKAVDVRTGRPAPTFLQGAGPANSFRLSADGRRLLTASNENGLQFWDIATGAKIGEALTNEPAYHGHASLGEFTVSPDCTRILQRNEASAVLLDANTGKPLAPPISAPWQPHPTDLETARAFQVPQEFSADSRRLAIACGDGIAKVFDAATGKELLQVHHRGAVRRACLSPDGRWLVTASDDNTAQIWDAATGAPVAPPIVHGGPVFDACFSRDGRYVVTASSDGTARVWEAATGRLACPPLWHAAPVSEALFAPDDHLILTVSDDRTARLWEWKVAGPELANVKHPAMVRSVSFSSDNRTVATVSIDGALKLWDLNTGTEVPTLLTNLLPLRCAEFSPIRRFLATGSSNGAAQVWDLATGLPVSPPLLHQGLINQMEFRIDGQRLLTAGTDRFARVWDVTTGKLIQEMKHGESVNYARYTSDGERIVTVSLSAPVLFHVDMYEQWSFDSAEREAITSYWGLVQVWNAETGRPLTLPRKLASAVSCVALSWDGRHAVPACAPRALTENEVWATDLVTGRRLRRSFQHDRGVIHASFSRDNKHLVTASWDHTARVWDATTGEPAGPPLKHQRSVRWAEFSFDGRLVVTASEDQTARVWDAATGEPVTPPFEHQAIVLRACFSPDAQRVVTMTSDGWIFVWDLPRANQTAQDVAELSQCLAGHRIDDTGAVLPLAPAMMQRAWHIYHDFNRDQQQAAPRHIANSSMRPAEDERAKREGSAAALAQAAERDADYRARATSAFEKLLFASVVKSNQWADVIELCSEAIDFEPNGAGPYVQRALAYEQIGENRKAVDDIRECLWRRGRGSSGDDARSFLLRGHCYQKLGEIEKAQADYHQVLEHPPPNPGGCANLVWFCLTGPRSFDLPEIALPMALKAVELSNTNLAYATVLAGVHSYLKQPQKAVDILEKAVQLDSDSESALGHNNLAWYYVTGPKEIRSPSKALPLALKAVELGKTNHNELNTLGVVYYRLGQFTNAVATLELGITTDPAGGSAHDFFFLSMSYQRLGDQTTAEDYYGKALKWLEGQQDLSPEDKKDLDAFRAEAEEALGKQWADSKKEQ
ncbi:MAG TPA: protein kinase [Verrucomicrobiae bacterium]